ncbi:SLBB domain-containing protein [Niveispirillum sp.]|uniref:SLBB domain-containing protein n=1 Tax=Niveispirillum sp. TaxID=1917217 RepID=UPI001B545579|nr:SLBB domain-containing protein [Niveispirillum sp.]MBP7334414.1 SLBB domain-containing protein [Niveispirillum sp.]
MRRVFRGVVGRRHLRSGLACAVLLVSAAMPGLAQTIELSEGSLDLQRLQGQMGMRGDGPQTAPSAVDRARLGNGLDTWTGSQPGQSQFDVRDPRDPDFGRDDSRLRKPSPLEQQYSQRGGRKLEQFGYDLRSDRRLAATALLNGAVPDDYVLGIGDELVVTLRGQANSTTSVRVDREGRVVLPTMAPVVAAGRTFGEFRDDLTAQAQAAFLQTSVFVSVGSVRSIGVLVTGEVKAPGRYTLTSFSSLIDALSQANGIQKTGSLRALRILRGDKSIPVDLYEVLLGSRTVNDLRLQDGDQIVVPAIGETVAVQGDVVRPGIYELRGREAGLSAVLELAGGPQRARGNRIDILRLDKAGRNQTIRDAAGGAKVLAGDILVVDLPRDAIALEGAAERPGGRGLAQSKTLRDVLNEPYLLSSNPYLPLAVIDTEDPVTRQRRYVPVDLLRVMDGTMNVSLRERDRVIVLSQADVRYLGSADVQAVLRGEQPPSVKLAVDRTVNNEKLAMAGAPVNLGGEETVPGTEQTPTRRNRTGSVNTISDPLDTRDRSVAQQQDRDDLADGRESQATGRQRRLIGTYADPQNPAGVRLVESDVECGGLQTLAALASEGLQQRYAVALRSGSRRSADTPVIDIRSCPKVFHRHPDLLPFLLEYAVSIEGEVRFPGVYPLVPGARADAVMRAVGGVTLDADNNSVEMTNVGGERSSGMNLSQLNQATLNPGDVVRVSARIAKREVGVVKVAGEVLRPGRYDIKRGERLSELLRRVDGLTPEAFPYGAVFTRIRVREAEEAGFRRAALELEQSIPSVLASTSGQEAEQARQALPFLQGLIASLKSTRAVGRVVVEVDPTVLAARPELDFVLEPGDELIIPKRPSHVTVSGEVLNASSVMFKSGKSARDYIKLAGGETPAAEISNAFVIYPNGESEPLRLGRFSDGSVPIPPGSTIVVPRDPQPFNFLSLTRTVVGLISDLALAAASLAVISRN